MRQSRFTESKVSRAVKQVGLQIPVREIARTHGVSERTIYLCKRKYDGLNPNEIGWLKNVKREGVQLKKPGANLSPDKEIRQDVS